MCSPEGLLLRGIGEGMLPVPAMDLDDGFYGALCISFEPDPPTIEMVGLGYLDELEFLLFDEFIGQAESVYVFDYLFPADFLPGKFLGLFLKGL